MGSPTLSVSSVNNSFESVSTIAPELDAPLESPFTSSFSRVCKLPARFARHPKITSHGNLIGIGTKDGVVTVLDVSNLFRSDEFRHVPNIVPRSAASLQGVSEAQSIQARLLPGSDLTSRTESD